MIYPWPSEVKENFLSSLGRCCWVYQNINIKMNTNWLCNTCRSHPTSTPLHDTFYVMISVTFECEGHAKVAFPSAGWRCWLTNIKMNIKWLWLELSFYQLTFESSKYQITEKNLLIFCQSELQLAVRSDYVKERFFNILEATFYSYKRCRFHSGETDLCSSRRRCRLIRYYPEL